MPMTMDKAQVTLPSDRERYCHVHGGRRRDDGDYTDRFRVEGGT